MRVLAFVFLWTHLWRLNRFEIGQSGENVSPFSYVEYCATPAQLLGMGCL